MALRPLSLPFRNSTRSLLSVSTSALSIAARCSLRPGSVSPVCFQQKAYSTPPSSPQQAAAELKKHTSYKEFPVKEMMSMKGKTVVITGGARGIGLAMGYAVAEAGANVAVLDTLDKPHDDFFELESCYGIQARAYKSDVTDGEALTKTFDEVVKDFGRIDSLITAAGIVVEKPVVNHTFEEVKKMQMVNVCGTYYSVQLAVKQMLAQSNPGGSILMIASIASHMGIPSQPISAYGASKGAVRILCKHLAWELGPQNIRVNTVSPGYISTDMSAALAEVRPELMGVFTREPPLKRMGERTDLKGATVYLLSDMSQYTTGADILVTGGLHAGCITTSVS